MTVFEPFKSSRDIALELQKSTDPSLQGLSSVTDKHLKCKDALFDVFLKYLAKDKYLSFLGKRYPNREDPGSLVSDKHLKCKDALFDVFLEYLAKDKNLAFLGKHYPNPDDPGSLVSNFVFSTRGPKPNQNSKF